MFQIIVAVIAIALAAALAAASIFYGGSAFLSSTAKAQTTTLINSAQQISGAQALYRTDNAGASANDIQDLVSNNYLQAVPTAPAVASDGTWTLTDDGSISYIEINSDNISEICAEVEKQNGGTDLGSFTDAPALTDLTGTQFRCLAADGGEEGDPAETLFAFRN